MKSLLTLSFALLLSLTASAKLTIREIRTASDNVIELFFTSDTLNVNEGKPASFLKWSNSTTLKFGLKIYQTNFIQCIIFKDFPQLGHSYSLLVLEVFLFLLQLI